MEFCLNACTLGGVPFGTLPVPDQIHATKASGFDSIGLDIKALDDFTAKGGSLDDLRAQLDREKLRALEIHPLRSGPGIANGIEEITRAGNIGARLGVSWICATATADLGDYAELIRQLRTCADRFAAIGMRLGIEFQPWLSIGSVGNARRLITDVDRPNVAIIVDPWHFFRGAADWPQLEKLTADEIAFVQFCDGGAPQGSAFADMGNRFLPGEGLFDLKRFANTLAATGFDGAIEVEVQSAGLRSYPLLEIGRKVMQATRPFWPASLPKGQG